MLEHELERQIKTKRWAVILLTPQLCLNNHCIEYVAPSQGAKYVVLGLQLQLHVSAQIGEPVTDDGPGTPHNVAPKHPTPDIKPHQATGSLVVQH